MTWTIIVLRLVHVVLGIYWAGSIFFFATILQPAVQDLGPDGGKVMVKLFERGYLTIVPIAAILTVLSGWSLIWIISDGFTPAWMGSHMDIALSTGGLLATIALLMGLMVMRPAALQIWDIAKEMPTLTDDAARAERMARLGALRMKTGNAARIIFLVLVVAVALMAVARYA